MKSLDYTMSLFKKAVKRDKPVNIFYDDDYYCFWFFTQKAVINYKANDAKDFAYMFDWLDSFNTVRWSFAI